MLDDKLNQYRNNLVSILDKAGGLELLNNFELIIFDRFKLNPFTDFLEIELSVLCYDNILSKFRIIYNNKETDLVNYNEDGDLKVLINNYIKYKLEAQGFYCVYDELNNSLKIKV